jgi:hypothetical protein
MQPDRLGYELTFLLVIGVAILDKSGGRESRPQSDKELGGLEVRR